MQQVGNGTWAIAKGVDHGASAVFATRQIFPIAPAQVEFAEPQSTRAALNPPAAV